MKLIKLTDTHYIIVDDSEIKEGDFVLFQGNTIEMIRVREIYTNYNNDTFYKAVGVDDINSYYSKVSKKIIHSTQPLGFLQEQGITTANLKPDWTNVKPLSLLEVEEAIYGYSVEEMAKPHCAGMESFKELFKAGFNAHKELVKDKLFTVEDMKEAFNAGYDLNTWEQLNIPNNEREYLNEQDYIQSLLPKTKWDIEFIDGKIKLI